MFDFWFGGGVPGLGVKGWKKESYDEKSAFFAFAVYGATFFFWKLGIFSVRSGATPMTETVAAP